MFKFKEKFKIRILYKSGNSQEFWCSSFTYMNGTYTWESCDANYRPIVFGADDVEAVYQVGHKRSLF